MLFPSHSSLPSVGRGLPSRLIRSVPKISAGVRAEAVDPAARPRDLE